MFPDAVWVSGAYLHRHNPRLERRWIEVTADTQVDALTDAVKYGLRTKDHDAPKRTMVFTNTVDSANSVSDILQRVGIPCVLYGCTIVRVHWKEGLMICNLFGKMVVCLYALMPLPVVSMSQMFFMSFRRNLLPVLLIF